MTSNFTLAYFMSVGNALTTYLRGLDSCLVLKEEDIPQGLV